MLLLVGIDVLILATYMAVEGVRGGLSPVTLPDREIPVKIVGVSDLFY